jgi:hypothetical protein
MKKGQHHSEATRTILRKQKLGKKLSPAHREKVVKTLNHGEGERNHAWKGGRLVGEDGYIALRLPDHPNARSNGYYPEHRLVMENHLKRLLKREEHVHHINGVKSDNRIENLVLTNVFEHAHHHWDDPEMRAKQSELMKKVRANKFWSTKPKS